MLGVGLSVESFSCKVKGSVEMANHENSVWSSAEKVRNWQAKTPTMKHSTSRIQWGWDVPESHVDLHTLKYSGIQQGWDVPESHIDLRAMSHQWPTAVSEHWLRWILGSSQK